MLKRLVIVLSIGVSLAGAQETTCRFRDGAAPTASVAYVLCEPSTVMVTADGGATWAARGTGAKSSLRAIAFTDATRGFVAGDGGLLLATEDGGKAWQARQTGVTDSLTDIEFSGQSGWISGYMGVMLNSGDGGRTWTRQTSGTSQSLESIFRRWAPPEPKRRRLSRNSRWISRSATKARFAVASILAKHGAKSKARRNGPSWLAISPPCWLPRSPIPQRG